MRAARASALAASLLALAAGGGAAQADDEAASGGAGTLPAPLTVPGRGNVWLSGMPDGAEDGGDSLPGNAPVLAVSGDLGGARLVFEVGGSVNHGGGHPSLPPDGGGPFARSGGGLNGMAGLTAPIDSLIGVFLADGRPDAAAPPPALDFSSPESRSREALAPALRQPFFIGDGRTEAGALQSFVAPEGATRLYLGAMDGWGWYNNSGAFTVRVAARPGAVARP